MSETAVKACKELLLYRINNEIAFSLPHYKNFCFEQIERFLNYLQAIAEIEKEQRQGEKNA